MKKNVKAKNFILKSISAVAVGFINGFFGGGGGLICVPTLERIYKLETKKAHATAVSIMLPLSIASSIIYIISNKGLNFAYAGAVTAGSIIGGLIGAFALKKCKSSFVRWLFIVILFVAGVRMVI
ncbi:MAG: sulfite exporter TauE/SafE family protein [Clostridia bacterium]|nr:sulfite exporter TauE/SafE family protein [Clostridia bacterium]